MKRKQSNSIAGVTGIILVLLLAPMGAWTQTNAVEINVATVADLVTATDAAQAGHIINLAEGTYLITSQIEIKSGVTYRGAGVGKTIIDGSNLTRAFVAWGDRTYNNTNENPNDSGPQDWVLEGVTIQNCVADENDLFAYAGAAFNMLQDFADNDVNDSNGLDIEEANADVGAMRLPGPDGNEPSPDDDVHRFTAMDTNGNGELSAAELEAQLLSIEVEFGDQTMDGGAVVVNNGAVGTIQNCEFLNNQTPIDGDDGAALAVGGQSVVTVKDCKFSDNASADDGGVLFIGGSSVGNILNCEFINNQVTLDGDDGGAIFVNGQSVLTADHCKFEGNHADGDDGDGGAIFIGDGSVGTLRNCEFLNNYIPQDGDDGGALFIGGSSLITIKDCTFSGNYTDGDDGGALFIGGGSVMNVHDCSFNGNYTDVNADDGGAISMAGQAIATLKNCLFDGNYAVSPNGGDVSGADGDAGHIKVQGNSSSALSPGALLICQRCDFLKGSAEDDGGAIQTSARGSIVRLDACYFEENIATDNGTVLSIDNSQSGELTVTNSIFYFNRSAAGSDRMCQVRRNSKFINCSFVDNDQNDEDLIYNNGVAIDTGTDGLVDEFEDSTEVVNCIFANNKVGDGDHVLSRHNQNSGFRITATHCLFFGNKRQNGDEAPNIRDGIEIGSVLADPLLDAALLPGSGSPAIDAGIDPALFDIELLTDFTGNPRPQGAGYDIGADEQ